jgi:anti-anti-sigma regulatory factor
MKLRADYNPFMMCQVTDAGVTTISPTRKRLTIYDVESLFAEAVHQIELGRKSLIVDFSEVERVCTSTAGFLLELKRRLDRVGGSLKLAKVPEELLQVLKLMGLEGKFEIIGLPRVLRNAG